MDPKVCNNGKIKFLISSNLEETLEIPTNEQQNPTLSQHFPSRISVPIQCSAEVFWDLRTSLAAVQILHRKMSS